ncbi:MAG: M50 family metallopeptidase [Candidatus Peribacteraceae bacterium]|nr:M50 family metallopeptidase [Candidatus Peribacteraceae bacterium]
MEFFFSALAFLLLLSVLILIHEWGHYMAAKMTGVVVEEFGAGLPPRILRLFTRKGTEFTLNWIPFGGFVRLKGENAIDLAQSRAPGSFGAASIPSRILILCAGVFMNFLLALLILTAGFSVGRWVPLSVYTSLERLESAAERGIIDLQLAVRIEDVLSGGGAAKVGVPEESILARIDGEPVLMPEDVMRMQEGKWRVQYTVLTGEGYVEEQTFNVVLADGEAGVSVSLFPLRLAGLPHSLPRAFVLALEESWHLMVQTTYGIGQLFLSLAQHGTVPEGISGIVGIAQYTHISVQEGLGAYLRLVALLSLSLAALNILPLPALDGGRLVFVLAELVHRRPINRKLEIVTNGIGFVMLLLLLLLITYHDILALF